MTTILLRISYTNLLIFVQIRLQKLEFTFTQDFLSIKFGIQCVKCQNYYYQIKNKFSKMTNRVREFNNIRDKRLSQSSSQLYLSSRNSECQPYRTSQVSRNLGKKEPICSDCVNHKLISQKKQKLQKEKQQQLNTEVQFQKIKLNQEKNREVRNKMLKQASRYNHKAIQQTKRRQQFQRNQDQILMKTSCNLQVEQIKNESKLQQQQRNKIEKYRRELQQQYKHQAIKKDLMKKQKFATEPNEPLIVDHDSTQMLKRYGHQLKKQIKQNQIRSQQLKKMQNQLDHQTLTNIQKDFFKYTEFSQTDMKKTHNPEIFEEMKQRQIQKKLQKIEEREKKLKDRKEELMKAKKQAQLIAQRSLKSSKSYASVLQTQIVAKKRQEQFVKKMQNSRVLEQIKSEEVKQQVNKKPCGQCCKSVKQIALSYY